MAKKKKSLLMMPKVHSTYNEKDLEDALINKATELLTTEEKEAPNYIFLTGNFFDVKGFSYSALRAWRGAVKPSEDSGRRPLLEATFASLSVYLSSLLSVQSDFYYAYEEIKDILMNRKREDLWSIIEEKLPFISLPPKEMYGKRASPISPYFIIKQDDDLTLGELYPSVYLTRAIKSIKSRFFVFFQHQGYTAFGFFNSMPAWNQFGFEQKASDFMEDPTPQNLLNYTKKANNLKEVLIALIHSHNNAYLEQFLIEDYELLLNKLLEGGEL
ncbi:MAG: hypothetical protein EU544_02810 [Promethearchaeota archaeon]|nr:MAG: hypothetical protein EU544_02810 [Candidatus Lokiarchaeota archaeon]